ncbi:MAG TPA: thiamine pyrophosphate-dependent enzyme [Thermoplasmata archaeon]|nr:thiamine pyrophosphate-dependent enzyme [Thermoplasmata archaeon]
MARRGKQTVGPTPPPEQDPTDLVELRYRETELKAVLGPKWGERLLGAYRWMRLGRALDRRMLALQRQGRIGFYGPATGQEAVSVGASLALAERDWVFPGLREQLLALARGHSLSAYLHHLFADDRDPARGRQMPCHPTAREVRYVSMSSVIGTQISQAVGLAYAQKLRRDVGVTMAFFGDGATSANDFHAGMNLAGALALPVVFCLTNNQWAISVPVERQTHLKILADKAAAYGFTGERVDGTDIVAVYSALAAALDKARKGAGPSLVECLVFRMTAHSSSDDPTRYQPADFLARGRARDPVDRLDRLLRERGVLTDPISQRLATEVEEEVRAAVALAESTPSPDPTSLATDVFFSPPSGAG